MPYEKTAMNFRLSAEARSALKQLATGLSISQTAIVEIAIREAYERRMKSIRQIEAGAALSDGKASVTAGGD